MTHYNHSFLVVIKTILKNRIFPPSIDISSREFNKKKVLGSEQYFYSLLSEALKIIKRLLKETIKIISNFFGQKINKVHIYNSILAKHSVLFFSKNKIGHRPMV